MPTTFDAICKEAVDRFKLTSNNIYFPETFLSGASAKTLNTSAWDTVTSVDAFPRVIGSAQTDNTYRTINVPTPAINNKPASTKPANIFSVLKLLQSVNSQNERYRMPESNNYWSNRSITVLDSSSATDPTLKPFYEKLTTLAIPGKASGEYIIKTMDFTGTSDERYSVSLDLLYSLKYEYCYWASLLQVLLGNLFTVQADTSYATTTAKNAVLRDILNRAASVNQRLNDIAAIITYVSKKQETELTTNINDINNAVLEIAQSQGSINSAVNSLSGNDSLSKLRSRMVEYNDEKNNYASTLLSLYGFANLVALGLLFYIYKS
jgi:hypothetical protein